MITPYLPYPLYSGGQIRTFNLLKKLSRRHQITLISFIRHSNENQYQTHLKPYTHKIFTIKRRPAWHPINILLSGFSPYPFLVSIYLSPTLKKLIKHLLANQTYDLIHAETFYVLPNIPPTNTPILLVEQTIEYLVYKRFAQKTKLPFIKPLLYLDVTKIAHWEKYYWKTIDRLVTVSYQDKAFIQKLTQRTDIDVVPNGIDFKQFHSIYQHNINRPKTHNVLFLGNFTWLPNKEALDYLVTHVWPLIHQRNPKAKLYVIGKNPTPKVISYHNPAQNIYIIGEVKDIKPYLKTIDLLLVPILNGRGTKYKVLESIAAGIPVVGTPLAVEGLPLSHKQDVLIGRTPQQLAHYTNWLLNNPPIATNLAASAIKKLKTQLSWDKVAYQLDKIYHQIKPRPNL